MYSAKYGTELAPVMRRLIHWGEIKTLAARLDVSVTWLERVARGATPLPAAMLPALVSALGPERGEELLHAVLDPLSLTWTRRADGATPAMPGLKLAMVADQKVTAFEQLAVAVDDGVSVPPALVRETASSIGNFFASWARDLCERLAERCTVRVASRRAA